jgi:mannose-1-phosphate guanylyltransferase
VFTLFEAKKKDFGTKNEALAIAEIYRECPSISIDYGIMEKAENVSVYKSDFGWSDLGTWGSLFEEKEKDIHNNAVRGEKAYVNNAKNCLIDLPENKIAVLNDINNLIIVESDGFLLVSSKKDEQNIKILTEQIKKDLGNGIL